MGRIVTTIALTAAGIPAPIASAGSTLAGGGNISQALGSAAGSYIGGNFLGNAGNVGPAGTLASDLGGFGSIGSSIANVLPSELAGSSVSSIGGGFLGANVGETLLPSLLGSGNQGEKAAPSPTAASKTPSWMNAGGLPSSLKTLDGSSPIQQSTNIANQGVYGGGAGGGERDYFLNLINSRLSDEDTSNDNLQPIEDSYLGQLGLGGYTDAGDLRKKMSQYAA